MTLSKKTISLALMNALVLGVLHYVIAFYDAPLLIGTLTFTLLVFINILLVSFIQLRPLVKQDTRIQAYLLNNHHISKGQEKLFTELEQKIISKFTVFNQAGGKITDSASHLAINAAEVAFFLQELFQAIEKSSKDADYISIAANDMSTTTAQVNEHATLASEQSDKAMQASRQGGEELARCEPIVAQLDLGVKEGTERINLLSTKASEIQKITEVIDSIAQQTNLLALNAAIEAARAGDQGRGFAVVADEVRALAGRTSAATSQIDDMLKVVNEESQKATSLMNVINAQSEQVVESVAALSSSFANIDCLISESSLAASHISLTLAGQESTTIEISLSINSISSFLRNEINTTKNISNQALGLCAGAESIFSYLRDFNTHSVIDTMSDQAQRTAARISFVFESQIKAGLISKESLFDFNYIKIPETDPIKYSTAFDGFTDKVLPEIQEALLLEFKEMVYAGAVDVNGYFPTHNEKFSKPLTGNYTQDVNNNRTKRIFDDPTGIRCGGHTQPFLLQTYKRDTGEVMHDVSAPIIVDGRHWGGFRIGFKAQDLLTL